MVPPKLQTVSVRPLRAGSTRPVILACLLFSLAYPLYVAADTWGLPFGRTVHIYADGRERTVRSFQRTVGDALRSARISVYPGDRIIPPAGAFLWPGADVKVIRAVPVVLQIGRSLSVTPVAATSVGDALDMMDVTLGPLDRVYPDAGTPVQAGMRITVERRAWHTWIEQRPVAFASRVIADPQVFKGNRIVRAPGREGLRERTVKALYADGRPVAMFPQAWTIVRPPVDQITALGTRAMIVSRGPFAGHEYMMLEATAYYPGPNNFGGGVGPRTAIGLLAQRGVVAVDPSVIPLGSRLFVEGYGYAIAGDTGGAIQGMRIDLCFNTYDEAIHFGRQTVKVYIIDRH